MNDAALKVENVSKSFGSHCVLDAVSLTVRPGQVHALVGENGAGKSTLMNLIGGIHQPSAGTMRVAGQPARFANPLEAIRAGIITATTRGVMTSSR